MKRVGIYNPYLDTRGGGERICLMLAETLAETPNLKVSIITHKPIRLDELGDYFQIDVSRLENHVLHFQTPFMRIVNRLSLPTGLRNFFYDVRTSRSVKNANFDIFINNCYQSNLPNPAKYGVYMCMFPQKLQHKKGEHIHPLKRAYGIGLRLLNRVFLLRGAGHAFDTYQLITANSAFTKSFITSRWNRDSEILYPYGEDFYDPKIKKQKVILQVGRFFENVGENHNKRHDFSVDQFKKLTELHKQGWELHLAGSVAEDTGTFRYILDLIKRASGYPVHFHFNAPYKELKQLFNQASIYWHATGYGTDAQQPPEKQEHFGITTVEAMSAKTIPVVINAAGQQESVTHGENGFLWSTPADLHQYTLKVSSMKPQDLEVLQTAVRKRYHQYDKPAFKKLARQIFSEVIDSADS